MKKLIKRYSFDKVNRTVTFTDYDKISIERILAVFNADAKVNLLLAGSENIQLSGTVIGNVLTLNYDTNTSAFTDNDNLTIYYDSEDFVFSYNGLFDSPIQITRGESRLLKLFVSNRDENPIYIQLFDQNYQNILPLNLSPSYPRICVPAFSDITVDVNKTFSIGMAINAVNDVGGTTYPVSFEATIDTPPVKYRGLILEDLFNTGTLDPKWIAIGSITAPTLALTEGKMTMVGGSGSSFSVQVRYNYPLCYEEMDFEIEFNNQTSGDGLGVGFGNANFSLCALLGTKFAQETNSGQFEVYSSGTRIQTMTERLHMITNQEIYRIRTRVRKDKFHCDLLNTKTGSMTTVTATNAMRNYSLVYNPAMYMQGGTCGITRVLVRAWAVMNPDIVFVGDSNTFGVNTNTVGSKWRYSTRIQNRFPSLMMQTIGVPGIQTSNISTFLPDVIALKPKHVFLMVGTNNAIQNNTVNYISELQATVNQLVAAGIKVYLINTPPVLSGIYTDRNPTIETMNANLLTVTGVEGVADIYTAINLDPNSGGDFHYNVSVHRTIANTIINRFPDLLS